VATVSCVGCFMQPSNGPDEPAYYGEVFFRRARRAVATRPGGLRARSVAEGIGCPSGRRGDDTALVDLGALKARRLFDQIVGPPHGAARLSAMFRSSLSSSMVLVPSGRCCRDSLEHASSTSRVERSVKTLRGDAEALLGIRFEAVGDPAAGRRDDQTVQRSPTISSDRAIEAVRP